MVSKSDDGEKKDVLILIAGTTNTTINIDEIPSLRTS